MRLSQREQIIIMETAHRYPGPIAIWLMSWVETQQVIGTGATFDIGNIPIPEPYKATELDPIISLHEPKRHPSTMDEKEEKQAQVKKLLESIGYDEMDKPQRLAIRMTLDAEVKTIEQTDRLPSEQTCWIGKHPMEGDWEALNNYLWVIHGTFASGISLRKWGCEDCARAVAKAHPEAILNAID